MSYHRVLPPPPALAIQDPSSWNVEPDSLLRHKIMTTETAKNSISKTKSLTPSQKALLPEGEKAVYSPGLESLEDYIDTPQVRARSSSQISNESHQRETRLPSVSLQDETPDQICLCQPDPKIPRPRNAFILYRQHHQTAVVAQHPGLANPEISKVIGDHWRSSPQETKNHWKSLAEQEKLRHQKLYPNYRYQPRRSGRNSSLSDTLASTSSTDAEARRCVKCGGRSIITPLVMSTPGFSSSASNTPVTPFTPNHPPTAPTTGSSAHRFLQSLNSPQFQGQVRFHSRPSSSSSNLTTLQLGSPRHPRDIAPSPDLKRRRVANGTYNAVRAPNGQLTPFPLPNGRRESLPRPDFMNHKSDNFSMGPPPRPNGRSNAEQSLKLAPLKTTPNTLESPASTRAKSVEAMVMSIHPLNKIRVLAKISPPLPPPGVSSPSHRVRGFAIAIDGSDMESVDQITESLSASLSLQHPVRVFESPINHVLKGTGGKGGEAEGNDFPAYLHIISQYHNLSKEIASYITTPPTSPPSSPSPVSPKTSTFPVSKPAHTSQKPHDRDPNPSSELLRGVPIALLPCFQLSHTNAFASRIPITDSYAPVDHWQWMATLWRGIIGPDITVAVLPALHPTAIHSATSTTSSVGSSSSNDPATRLNTTGNGGNSAVNSGVEARLEDARAILVRGESGKTGIGEGKLRRVGFEVGEWVRSGDDGRRGS